MGPAVPSSASPPPLYTTHNGLRIPLPDSRGRPKLGQIRNAGLDPTLGYVAAQTKCIPRGAVGRGNACKLGRRATSGNVHSCQLTPPACLAPAPRSPYPSLPACLVGATIPLGRFVSELILPQGHTLWPRPVWTDSYWPRASALCAAEAHESAESWTQDGHALTPRAQRYRVTLTVSGQAQAYAFGNCQYDVAEAPLPAFFLPGRVGALQLSVG